MLRKDVSGGKTVQGSNGLNGFKNPRTLFLGRLLLGPRVCGFLSTA